jgi:DNA-binding transcriptional ArsR family regulator
MQKVLTAFEVVAEPNRRRILDLLCADARSVGELVDALGMNQPAVSKHLRVLKAARLVDVEVDAQRRVYRLRPEPLLELEEWLAPYRRFWSDRLDLLGRHLDRMPDPPRSRSKQRRKR